MVAMFAQIHCPKLAKNLSLKMVLENLIFREKMMMNQIVVHLYLL
jgi:hypothetical protein